MPQRKRALIIVNPTAGRGRGRRLLQHALPDYMAEIGITAELYSTCGPGDGARRIAAKRDYDHIVVVGGDGTINEVLEPAGPEMPVGLIPLGTANAIARALGIPSDVAGALKVIRYGVPTAIDLGRLTRDDSTSRAFGLCASAGIDAAVVHTLAEGRKGSILLASYLKPILRHFISYPMPEINVTVDGETLPAGCRQVVIANTGHYAIRPMMLHPHSSLRDGKLTVVALYPRSRARFLRYALAAFTGGAHQLKDAIVKQATNVELSSEAAVPLQVDGDPAGMLPARFNICPAAACMIAPASYETPADNLKA